MKPKFKKYIDQKGQLHQRVTGDKLILLEENQKRFKVFVPFDKKAWIEIIKSIPGRAWNIEEKYWSIPYVKDSFRLIWAEVGKTSIQLGFSINSNIPEIFQTKKIQKQPKIKLQLSPVQKLAVTAFEERLLLEHKSYRTIKTYKSLFQKFLAFHTNIKPSSITSKQIEQYIIVCKQQNNMSDTQLNQLINTINAFYCRVLTQKHKVLKLKRPKKKKKMPNVLSIKEVESLLKTSLNIKHKSMLMLIYSGGLRKSELINLRLQDISFDRKTILVKNGKGGKDRYTFFSEIAQKYLQLYLNQYKPKYWLFEGQKGGQYSETSLQRVFEKTRQQSNINPYITIHGLRHSFATHLIEKGVPLHVVQELLGHNSIKTTEIYLHISNKFRKELKSPLDDLDL